MKRRVGSIYSHSPIKYNIQEKCKQQNQSNSSIHSFQSQHQSELSFNSQTDYQFIQSSHCFNNQKQSKNESGLQQSYEKYAKSNNSSYQQDYYSQDDSQTSRSTQKSKHRPCQIQQSWFDSLTKYGKPAQAQQSVVRKLMLINNIFKELIVFKQQLEPQIITNNVSRIQDFLIQVEKSIIKNQMIS